MTLISCRECEKRISDLASSCPHCGVSLEGIVTIERTSKRLKLISLTSRLVVLLGFALILTGGEQGSDLSIYGIFTCVVGLSAYIVNKIRIWWYHD